MAVKSGEVAPRAESTRPGRLSRGAVTIAVAASLATGLAGPAAAQSKAGQGPGAGSAERRAVLPKPRPGTQAPSRWAEDWTVMRDPEHRKDPIDRLKYIQLDADGDVYLTLSGEFRLRYNENAHLDLRGGDSQHQEIRRVFAAADLHLGSHVRAFTEVAHAGLSGNNLGARPPSLDNDLFLQQGFVDFTGTATTRETDVELGMRVGRQEFTEGPQPLVALRDNNTVRFTLNGVRAWAATDTARVTLFDLYHTRMGSGGIGDDRINRDVRFSGVSSNFGLPTALFGGSRLYLDPFAWRLRTRAYTWGGTTAHEERGFYGVRLWGDIGRFGVDVAVNHQDGEFGGRSISAWQLFSQQSMALGSAPGAPRIGIRADYASGGGSFSDGTLRNATTPHGDHIRYSHTLNASSTNFAALAPNVSFRPFGKARMTLEYQFAWRDSIHDGVYRANGTMIAGTESVSGRRIGEMLRAQIVWPIAPRLTFTGRYEHLDAGPALTQAGYGDTDFIAAFLSFRF